MPNKIDSAAHIGKVVLKVNDLKKQVQYYTNSIGLDVLHSTNEVVQLGVKKDGVVLLELRKVSSPLSKRRKAGLYHVAFLLPTRKDLGNILYALLKKQVPLVGASDHGYSEAIYLQDPEGNGIEIYIDKPMNVWDIKKDGRIAGITVEMDAKGVLAGRDQASEKFPAGSKVGHVHLSVADLEKTRSFYTNILGMSIKDYYGNQAIFFAAGEYHHHVGTNNWLGKTIPAPEVSDLGLDYYTLIVSNMQELNKVKDNAEKFKEMVLEEQENSLMLIDPNGIKVKIINEK